MPWYTQCLLTFGPILGSVVGAGVRSILHRPPDSKPKQGSYEDGWDAHANSVAAAASGWDGYGDVRAVQTESYPYDQAAPDTTTPEGREAAAAEVQRPPGRQFGTPARRYTEQTRYHGRQVDGP